MTGTANAALHKALDWILEVVEVQPFGEVAIVVTIQNGNVVLIKKTIQETDKP
jgi:predicted SnoaL-like aldol condensation-catalyzing enzyme